MHSIWAVATNTIKQALRMRIAAVFIILLLVLLPSMAYSLTGDGTLKGRLQTFVSYSLSLTSLLLCLLTVMVSVYTVTSDISEKQIFTVITKPIRRFQLLLGKLLGVILLNGVLLALFSGMIYLISVYMPNFSDASSEELLEARKEFFTARAGLTPAEVDVTREAEAAYEKLQRSGQIEQVFRSMKRKEILSRLARQKQLSKRAAGVGQELIWEFEDMEVHDPNQNLFIRFKYAVSATPPDQQVYGRWLIGDIRQIRYGTRPVTPLYEFDTKDTIRTFQEIEVPADAIADDGYLAVGFLNVPLNNTVVIFPLEDGLEVLYKADTYGANFARAVILIWLRLIFLASLGVLASTFLSFPVAMLLCLVIFFTANFSGFVLESFDYLSESVGAVYSLTLRPIIRLLPQFDKFSPTKYLISARLLDWSLLGKAMGLMVSVKALLLLLLGLIIFRYRELARITI